MEERESTPLVLLPYWEEVPSTWKGEVQEKLTPSQLKDVGRKETSEGKHIGQGTVYSFFLPWGPDHQLVVASEMSGCVWKRKEYWVVGTYPWGHRGR